MKKWILVMTAILLAASMTGCSMLSKLGNVLNAGTEALKEESGESEEVSEENTEVSSEESESQIADTPDTVEEANRVEYRISTKYDSEYSDTDYSLLASLRYDTIEIISDDTPQLKEAISTWNADYSQCMEEEYIKDRDLALVDYQDEGLWFEGMYYGVETDFMVRRADTTVFSILNPGYSYAGGAHGYYGYDAYNYDSQTGDIIHTEDIITDSQAVCDALETEFLKKYSQDELLYTDDLSQYIYDTYFGPNKEEYSELVFLIGYDGISVYFNPYEIASYGTGIIELNLFNSVYPDLLSKKYFSPEPENYLYQFPSNGLLELDRNQDGNSTLLNVYGYMAEEYEYDGVKGIKVLFNGKETSMDYYMFSYEVFYVKNNEKSYVYVKTIAESDSYSILIFDINSDAPLYVGECYGYIENAFDPANFTINKRLDVLSTYDGTLQCHVGDDGMPVADTEEYSINSEITLTSTVELTGELIDETTGESLGSSTVPAGSQFLLKYTDGSSYIKMYVSGIGLLRFNVDTKWPQTINGVNAEECFEVLYFAG